jgi:hypothetical protein
MSQKSFLHTTAIFSLFVFSFGLIQIPGNALSNYELPANLKAKIANHKSSKKIDQLSTDYTKDLSNDPVIAQQEYESIMKNLAVLNVEEALAFKSSVQDKFEGKSGVKKSKKEKILTSKFEYEYSNAVSAKFNGKTQYQLNDNEKKQLEGIYTNQNELGGLYDKMKNPNLVPDSAFAVTGNALTTFCGWDSNWPASISVGAWNWQGPTYWYYPTWGSDARNTVADYFCDYKVGGVPSNQTYVHGRTAAGGNAISCYGGSLSAKSSRNEVIVGDGCATNAGIYNPNVLKDNLKFSRNY